VEEWTASPGRVLLGYRTLPRAKDRIRR